MVYNNLYNTYGFLSYVLTTLMILGAFFVHQFAKVVIANLISADCVKKGVPIKTFIEPIGFILMALTGVGWSNGPEINAVYFKDRKRDTLKIYLGAVFVSIVVGTISIVSLNLLVSFIDSKYLIKELIFLRTFGKISIAVGVMNLIPIYPFSGYYFFYELSSPNMKMWLINNKNLIQVIFILLLIWGIVGRCMNLIIDLLINIIDFISLF